MIDLLMIPAVNIINKKTVCSDIKDIDGRRIYKKSEEAVISMCETKEFNMIHVTNLSDVKSKGNVNSLLKLVKKFPNKLQVAGGIDNYAFANQLLENGAKSIVIGSAAARKEEWINTLLWQHKEKVVISLNVKTDFAEITGSRYDVNARAYELLDFWFNKGFKRFLIADIYSNGQFTASNIDFYKNICRKYVGIKVIAAAKVFNIEDIQSLSEINLYAIILGENIVRKKQVC